MKRYLILADETIYEGEAMGAEGDAIGEVVFTTGMGGYMDTINDPTNFGQLIVQTFPLIGNAGAIFSGKNNEKPALSGYIVREICEKGSNYLMDCELNEYLLNNNVVGICGIDTRSLTRKLRNEGVMNGMITASKKDLEEKLSKIKAYRVIGGVEKTTAINYQKASEQNSQSTEKSNAQSNEIIGNGKTTVTVMNFGAKLAIEDELIKRDCKVIRVSAFSSAEEILALKPHGIVLSGGAGDPFEYKAVAQEVKKLTESKIPMLAIGLGHQLLAISQGAKTVKLKHGHRGANQPVKNSIKGRVYMTAQNHGYTVLPKTVPDNAEVIFTNINDSTCEGIEYKDFPAVSVQFHPETCGGTQEIVYLFDDFVAKMSI